MARNRTSSKVKKKTNEKDNVNFVQLINTENENIEDNSVDISVSTESCNTESEILTTYTIDRINTNSKNIPHVDINNEIVATPHNKRFEYMSLDLLLKYKEAISSLNKDYIYLSEINKNYDNVIYNEALYKTKKMQIYLEKINNVIENKILEIKID